MPMSFLMLFIIIVSLFPNETVKTEIDQINNSSIMTEKSVGNDTSNESCNGEKYYWKAKDGKAKYRNIH